MNLLSVLSQLTPSAPLPADSSLPTQASDAKQGFAGVLSQMFALRVGNVSDDLSVDATAVLDGMSQLTIAADPLSCAVASFGAPIARETGNAIPEGGGASPVPLYDPAMAPSLSSDSDSASHVTEPDVVLSSSAEFAPPALVATARPGAAVFAAPATSSSSEVRTSSAPSRPVTIVGPVWGDRHAVGIFAALHASPAAGASTPPVEEGNFAMVSPDSRGAPVARPDATLPPATPTAVRHDPTAVDRPVAPAPAAADAIVPAERAAVRADEVVVGAAIKRAAHEIAVTSNEVASLSPMRPTNAPLVRRAALPVEPQATIAASAGHDRPAVPASESAARWLTSTIEASEPALRGGQTIALESRVHTSLDSSQLQPSQLDSPVIERALVDRQSEAVPPRLRLEALLPQSGRFAAMLGEEVVMLRASGADRISLALEPAELGRLEIHVRVRAETTHVSFVVQNASVRDALETQLSRLRTLLEASGLSLGDVNVGGSEDGARDAQAHPRRTLRFADSPATRIGIEPEGDTAAAARRDGSLVDVHV